MSTTRFGIGGVAMLSFHAPGDDLDHIEPDRSGQRREA